MQSFFWLNLAVGVVLLVGHLLVRRLGPDRLGRLTREELVTRRRLWRWGVGAIAVVAMVPVVAFAVPHSHARASMLLLAAILVVPLAIAWKVGDVYIANRLRDRS